MQRYNPAEIEPKWQALWDQEKRYSVTEQPDTPKMYVSGMFPYPSGSGLHSGHAFSYTIVDTIARFYRAHGRSVLNPMGWDTFGLPAENYAIKTGTAPAVVTKENIANFKTQFKRLGISIDWDRELNTSDPEYYRWTQWVFAEFFKRGLAYQKESLQWWCPVDKTVLANEQVEAGKCWRCGNEVEKKSMKQWFFKITNYADALLDEIPNLDWPDKIKTAQTNWIGRSQGAEVNFQLAESDEVITVFTTRPDTIFGATFMVLAPEHPLVTTLTTDAERESVEAYVKTAVKKSEIERMSEGKQKTGVFTGGFAVNPATGENIPVWVADYVLYGYGTGAIMAVPAHDERDYDFATAYKLPIRQVVAPEFYEEANPPRDDKEDTTRTVVMNVIEHPTDGTFLTNAWRKFPWTGLVMGGVEEGEESVEAAKREIVEETGYTDLQHVATLPLVMNSKFFAEHKDVNRNIFTTVHRFKLNSLDSIATQREAHEDFDLVWKTRTELESLHPLPEKEFILPWLDNETVLYHGDGVLVNSGQFNGMPTSEAREEIVAWLEQQGVGKATTTYKMRDWLISRQRYWGAPIPIIHCEKDGAVVVPDDQLPVVLPDVKDYAPKGDGRSALAAVDEWVNTTCPTCNGPAKRETDTMDGYACSSWYLLRYADPRNDTQAWNPDKANYWSPVDYYVGGDHAVAHLLYVRFWAHVFNEMGLLNHKEPVKKLIYHGYVNAEDGRKMSKSLGNVIDPLDIIDQGYGADTLRTYVLFMGPIELDSAWSSQGVGGVYRFLNRTWTLAQEYLQAEHVDAPLPNDLEATRHRTIKKVTQDYHNLSFNTAIAALMEYVNELYKAKTNGFSDEWQAHIESLVQLLGPFAPHMTAELWQQLGHNEPLDTASWPTWDETLTKADTITVAVQVNGKLRATLTLPSDVSEADATNAALSDEKIKRYVTGQPKKVIYVAGRLISIVI